MATAWANKTVAQLLRGYAHTLTELKARGVIRSNNPPSGDYAEWLCAKALNGTIADNRAEKSYDLTLTTGETVQVKARVVSTPRSSGQVSTSPFRSWSFDLAALVLFRDTDHRVEAASLLPRSLVEKHATWGNQVHGHVLQMNPKVLSHEAAVDITQALRDAASAPLTTADDPVSEAE